jgi:hypothetical protein
MNFQGTLADGGGAVLPDGNYNLTFRLWNSDVGGAILWTEAQSVSQQGGIFNTVLGDITPLNLAFDQPYWLGVQVGVDAELSPRSPLTGMPYAMNVVDGAGRSGRARQARADPVRPCRRAIRLRGLRESSGSG